MECAKRRGRNFTQEDIDLLVELVETKRDILENKMTNKESNESKNVAWTEIHQIFNASVPEKRTILQLKNFFNNLKKKSKNVITNENKRHYFKSVFIEEEENEETMEELLRVDKAEKKELTKAGEVPCCPILHVTQERMVSILGDTVRPLRNQYDDAIVHFNDAETHLEAETVLAEIEASNVETKKLPFKKKNISLFKTTSEMIRKKYYFQKLRNAKIQERILKIELQIKEKTLKNLEAD